MVLDRIIPHKREEVARRKAERPLNSFVDQLIPSHRSFARAIEGSSTGYVLEVKRASPSRGTIRAEKDFDPEAIAKSYNPIADAISVVTDRDFFGGGFDVLERVRAGTTLPVLCKDFVVDPYQVCEARLHGADAVLLMLAVLDDRTFRECAAAAASLSMDALVEVDDHDSLTRARSLGAEIVGINNRDLRTLEVDITRTMRLAPAAGFARSIVCESGISTHAQVRELRPHVDAFLVGTALMERRDLATAVRELVFGTVKVCGITREEDARAASEAGAIYGGLIFAESSPRRVEPEQAARLVRSAPSLRWVGVFVGDRVERIARLADELNLAAVQVIQDDSSSGRLDEAFTRRLRAGIGGEREIWVVRRVRDKRPDLDPGPADRVLLDTFDPGRAGGTGRAFDWSLIAGADLARVVLSGGLRPELAAAADMMGAGILDVCSGVEAAPGRKDRNLLRDFFAALRGQGAERGGA